MTSPSEMINVGGRGGHQRLVPRASATENDALATVELVARAGEARLALEKQQGATEEIAGRVAQVVRRSARQRPPARRIRSVAGGRRAAVTRAFAGACYAIRAEGARGKTP